MNVILGIDTGGTYTDGVLIEFQSKKILRSTKVLTTGENLAYGIDRCIEKLNISTNEKICQVCISTTLATNAVVENKCAKVGLITIGNHMKIDCHAEYITNINGRMDVMGREVSPIFENEVENALYGMKGKVETLAISGYACVKNPRHELLVKAMAERILGIPTVCGHEMSAELGYAERTVTSVLNASLIPIITELMKDIDYVLKSRKINVPMMVLKGTGHGVISEYAAACPIETILSGPAASVMGARFLSNIDDAIVVDIGGTTTDILSYSRGEAIIDKRGMNVGGRRTKVKAIQAHTFGLGGDSRLHIRQQTDIVFGPERAEPVCVAAALYPNLINELNECRLPKEYVITMYHDTDCIRLLKRKTAEKLSLSEKQRKILWLLSDTAHTVVWMAKQLGTDIDSLELDELLELGLIQMISFTPTDLLHVTGEYTQWNREASIAAAHLIAERIGMKTEKFVSDAEDLFVSDIRRCIIKAVLAFDGLESDSYSETFIKKIEAKGEGVCSVTFGLNNPIIGVGASAGIWVKKAGEGLNCNVIIPEHCECANAVGAAISDVREQLEAYIVYDQMIKKYIAYLPKERKVFMTLEEAQCETKSVLEKESQILAGNLGLSNADIEVNEKDLYIDSICSREKIFVQAKFFAEIRGKMTSEI